MARTLKQVRQRVRKAIELLYENCPCPIPPNYEYIVDIFEDHNVSPPESWYDRFAIIDIYDYSRERDRYYAYKKADLKAADEAENG